MKRLGLHTLAAIVVLAAVGSEAGGAGTAARPLRVVAVNPPGIPFKGTPRDDPVLRGLRRAVNVFGVDGRAVTLGARENFVAALSSLAAQRYDLVIAGTGEFLEAVETVAPRFPQTTFLMTDTPVQSVRQRHRNVAGTDFRQQEASYLGGYLAALMAKRGSAGAISSVGGMKVPPVDSLIAGYQAGARKAVRGLTTLNGYANSFSDPAKCRAVAVNQIAKGSGVVFQVAGGCGVGSLAAAKENGVWGIGVDDDQSYLGAHILTSVLKRFDVATFRAIQAFVRGRLSGGRNIVLDLRNGGVGLGKISPKVPRSFVARVERIRRQIVSGRIRDIPTTVP